MSSQQATISPINDDQPNNSVEKQNEIENQSITNKTLTQVLFFSFLMFSIPLPSYFIAKKKLFEEYLEFDVHDSAIPAAMIAFFMVHIILVLYVYLAFTEDIPKKKKSE